MYLVRMLFIQALLLDGPASQETLSLPLMPPDATGISVLFDGWRVSNLTLVDLAGITNGYVAQTSFIFVLDFYSDSDGTKELLLDGPASVITVLGKDVMQALLLDGPASETRIVGTDGAQ